MTLEPITPTLDRSFNADRISWARNLEQRSFRRCVLYGTAFSAGLHIALSGIVINTTKDLIINGEPTRSIDFVVMETPSESKSKSVPIPVNNPVAPVSETVHIPPSLPSAVPKSTSRLTSRSVSAPSTASSRELSRESSLEPTTTIPHTRTNLETTPDDNPQNFTDISAPAPSQAEATQRDNPSPTDTAENSATANPLPDGISSLLRGIAGSAPAAPPAPEKPTSTPTTETSPERIRCLRCDKPEYPAEARSRNLEGQTKVSVDVDSNGNVVNVRLVQSSGHPELDQAALQQARRWQFSPSSAGKQGINGRVDFQLEGSDYQRRRRQEAAKDTPTETSRETARESVPTPKIEPITPPSIEPPPVRETAIQPNPKPRQTTPPSTVKAPIEPPPITAPRETPIQPISEPRQTTPPAVMVPIAPPAPVEPPIPSENP